MRTMHRLRYPGALAAPLLLFAASSAFAQDATVYGSESDYDAAAGASDFLIDFNGSPGAFVPGDSFGSDVVFGSPEATDPGQVNWSSDAISDAGSTTASNGVGPLDGTFAGTVHAFRFVLSSASTPETVEIFGEDGASLGSFTAPSASGFFGVVSTKPVKRFLVTPGVFDPALGDRDRFFIDDLGATREAAAPPPPAADLETLCHDFAAAVAAADASAFRGRNRQRALANKLRVVCARIADGDVAALCSARHKLEGDILRKMDGERSPPDWVTDAMVQQALEDQGAALVAALDDAIAALGGCPSHDGDDDGDDDDQGEDGGSGRPENPGSQGRGHGHGHANGHGNGHAKGHGNGLGQERV